MSKRAERRHHRYRLKETRKGYHALSNMNERHKAQVINTPTPCSCHMCCNLRSTEGPTIQERRFLSERIEP